MTPDTLKRSRRELGLNRAEMANRLRTPYRTYVDWERGARRIPGSCEVAMELLVERDRRFMQSIGERIRP